MVEPKIEQFDAGLNVVEAEDDENVSAFDFAERFDF